MIKRRLKGKYNGMFSRLTGLFGRRLFGAKGERLRRSVLIWLVLFWALRTSGLSLPISPAVLCLTCAVLTAAVMQQALTSENNRAEMQNVFMLPFKRRAFALAYVFSLSAYTLLTRTAGVFVAALALGNFTAAEILGCLLCAANAALMTAWGYTLRVRAPLGKLIGIFWGIAFAAVTLRGAGQLWFLWAMTANGMVSFLLVQGTDPYGFWPQEGAATGKRRRQRGQKEEGERRTKGEKKKEMTGRAREYTAQRYSVSLYLLRYLFSHKNYLVNTAALWGVAWVLPLLWDTAHNPLAVPLSLAILTLNTPICILLSCDPSTEQAVRFLPGQKRSFFLPYCLFIFCCNMAADTVYLVSLWTMAGIFSLPAVWAAIFFALQSAVCSALLEWRFPVRGWRLESDLWHHPRKYAVPGLMVLLAGAMGLAPWLLGPFSVILAMEMIWLMRKTLHNAENSA